MGNALVRFCTKTHLVARSLRNESGQDLVEYALVIAVVCLGIISGMNTLANGINVAMATLSDNISAAMA